MADMNQLYTALRNADAAGRTEDVKRLTQYIQQMQTQQPQGKDGAFSYSVDQAQRLGGQAIRTIGSAIGSDTVTEMGKDIIAQQDKDIAEGGYVSPLGDMTYLEALDQGKGMQWIATRGAENAVTIGTAPVAAAGGALAAFLGAPITAAAIGVGGTAASVGLGIGGVTETAEQKGLDVEDQSTAAKNVAIGSVIGILDRIGAKGLIPKDKLAKMSVGEVTEELAKKDPGLAKKFLGATFKGGAKEGTTEVAQTGVETAGVAAQGGEFTADEVINNVVDNFVLGGATGSAVSGTVQTAQSATNAVTGGKQAEAESNEAAADFARDLEQVTADDGFDLQNVDPTSTEGARAAVDAVHKNYTGQMAALVQQLKDQLKLKDTDPEAERLDKVQARIAYEKGRNKTKNTVGKKDMEAVQKLVGNSKEGQELIRLLKKSNELTRVHNGGLKGGVSRITDRLNPFDSGEGYSGSRSLAAPLVSAGSAGAAVGTGGASVLPQVGAVLGGRAIDAMTGRRSRVAKFVRDNAKNQGLGPATGPSIVQGKIDAQRIADEQAALREQKAAEDQASRERANRALGASGAAPTPGSPQDIMELGTGLDKNGVARVMDAIENIPSTEPAIIKAIQEYRISIDKGGEIDNKMLSPLIKAVNELIRKNPQFAELRIAEPVRGELTETEARKRRGEVANKQALRELRKALNADNSIPIKDKQIINQALSELGGKLGPRPLEAALDIVADAEAKLRRKDLADDFLMPYVDRISKQQRGRTDEAAA